MGRTAAIKPIKLIRERIERHERWCLEARQLRETSERNDLATVVSDLGGNLWNAITEVSQRPPLGNHVAKTTVCRHVTYTLIRFDKRVRELRFVAWIETELVLVGASGETGACLVEDHLAIAPQAQDVISDALREGQDRKSTRMNSSH